MADARLRWLAFAAAVAAAGCRPANPSYIEARGTMGDGSAFNVHWDGRVDASANPWLLQASGDGPGGLAGFWLAFDPSVVNGMTYPSTGTSTTMGAVHFYVLRPLPDGNFGDVQSSLVDGGMILFTSAGPDNYAGTLAHLALQRNGATLATVDGGAFLAAR